MTTHLTPPLIRVAIAGASGTGKTTLAEAIADRYGLPINPVGARLIAASMNLSSPYDVDKLELRAEFQRKLFHGKRYWESQHHCFVTDRTIFDNLAYCLLHVP